MIGRLAILFLSCAILAGCNGEAESAERQYEIATNGADNATQCREARKVQAAWLKRENVEKFEQWKLTADIACLSDVTERALHDH